MKICKWCKDGGSESHVWSFILIEWKALFTVTLLKFDDGSREAYHNHAFNAWSWLLRGRLTERVLFHAERTYRPSLKPIFTARETFHMVVSEGTSYALTFRGPWDSTWLEYLPTVKKFIRLTNGRQEVGLR